MNVIRHNSVVSYVPTVEQIASTILDSIFTGVANTTSIPIGVVGATECTWWVTLLSN